MPYLLNRNTDAGEQNFDEIISLDHDTLAMIFDAEERGALLLGEPVTSGNYTFTMLDLDDDNVNCLSFVTIQRMAKSFCEFVLRERGYDEARFVSLIQYDRGSPKVTVLLRDDFQRDIPEEYRCRNGYVIPTLQQLASPGLWPSREIRELEVMLARSAASSDFAAKLRSEAAKQFVADLTASTESLRNLLPKD